MNWKVTILALTLAVGSNTSTSAQSLGDAPAPAPAPLTSEQSSLFDELMENEINRDPMAAAVLESNPAEAATLVEIEEGELPPPGTPLYRSRVTGTFIQLSRAWADVSVAEWREVLRIVRDAGMNTVIIQWSAAQEIAYFEPAPEQYTEFYPVLNRLFEAAEGQPINIVLGLSHDPLYWKNIETRNDVRDVYFRVRSSHNLRIQESLLELFEDIPNWTGYYLSEEIDDINWREPAEEEVFHQYLLRSSRIIEDRDENRSVSISSFFRKRTAPSTYSGNLRDLMNSTTIDHLWIQDGIGVEMLSASLIEPYYRALATQFSTPPPSIGVVVEIFEMTSSAGEPFAAQTALASRVENQLKNASLTRGPITLFSLFDYADPRQGGEQEAVYELIRDWNRSLPLDTTVAETEPTPPPVAPANPAPEKPAPAKELPPEVETSPLLDESAPSFWDPLIDPSSIKPPKGAPGKPPSFEPDPKQPTVEPITGLRYPYKAE
tara:strand:- start:172 stop:1644 length:1473 start_codon:yes stop_codon:yes gene_type:complete